MTDGGCGPEVVHRPHYGFMTVENPVYVLYREHALVYPVQMYNVSLAKLTGLRDVGAGICDVNLEEVVAFEMQSAINNETFPQEVPFLSPCFRHLSHGDIVGHLVSYEHFCLYPVIVKRLLQSVGGNCRPTCIFACVYNQHSHDYCPFLFISAKLEIY